MEATMLCRFNWYGPACWKFSEITNHQYIWKGLSYFVDILLDTHCSYKNMLFWVGIVRHRLLANQLARCFEFKKLENYMRYKLIFCFHRSCKKIYYFGLWPQDILGQPVCRIFYFWLSWLVNVDIRDLLLHYTFSNWQEGTFLYSCFTASPLKLSEGNDFFEGHGLGDHHGGRNDKKI